MPVSSQYRFNRAEVIVSLDADFLASPFPGHLRYAHDFSAKRRQAAEDPSVQPSRLYVAETSPSLAGGIADHRFRMSSAGIEAFADELARALGIAGTADDGTAGDGPVEESETIAAVARDLEQHRGSSLIIAGEFQSARVHAMAHALNEALANRGQTVAYTERIETRPVDQVASIATLVDDIRNGAVENLLILGGNPVYDAPADLDFMAAMEGVPLRIHLGLYENETAALCHWHVPEAHFLESWGDARAFDGTASIVQPLIEPIYDGKTPIDVMNILLDQGGRSSYQTVRGYWIRRFDNGEVRRPASEERWRQALHDGLIGDSAFASFDLTPVRIPSVAVADDVATPGAITLHLRPDPAIGDGELANNAWLQELPDPHTKITWDNAVWMSPATAERLELDSGDRVELTAGGRTLQGPVWIVPGQADECLTVHLGYGRARAGGVGNAVGFDAYRFRTASSLWRVDSVDVRKIDGNHRFASTQTTQTMEDREPVRMLTYGEMAAAGQAPETPGEEVTLFPLWPYPDHKWGMSIDLASCIGCNACMVACQSENNIPVVGKEEVAKGRHMNWIRVDRYHEGDLDDPTGHFEPVPCMHCEYAMCELVCPTAATVHSSEGLNQMIYNRCVGTRYCSNNCPYKVRRFNFLLYSDWYTESLKGARNPDVTVRSRGVMEKCTYCVQRIERARIEAKTADRSLTDGDIVTACQQACPAQAIVFGDLNDPNSAVSQRVRQSREYALLAELNTRPRTTYLAKLRNPNPELEDG